MGIAETEGKGEWRREERGVGNEREGEGRGVRMGEDERRGMGERRGKRRVGRGRYVKAMNRK